MRLLSSRRDVGEKAIASCASRPRDIFIPAGLTCIVPPIVGWLPCLYHPTNTAPRSAIRRRGNLCDGRYV